MKRILTLVFAIAIGTGLYAIDKQALADTLTHFVKSRAYTSNVTVSRVRVRNSQVFIYTNRTLSQVSLSNSEVRDLRLLVSQMILGNNFWASRLQIHGSIHRCISGSRPGWRTDYRPDNGPLPWTALRLPPYLQGP